MFRRLWQKLNPSGFVFRYYLATFFAGLMFYVSVLVPFYTQWGGLNLTQVQILQSWLMIWMFIFNIPTGVFADHFGRKVSIALGSFILAISCVLYFLTSGFYPFLIAEFIAALGTSFMIGAGNALIYDYLKQNNRESDSKHVIGRSSSISNLGMVIAAPIGSIIAAHFGIRAPMLFTTIPLLITSLIILTVHESKNNEELTRPNPIDSIKKGFQFFISNKNLQFLVFNDLLVWIGAYFLIWLYQPMLIKVGVAIIYFGFIRSAFSLSGMAATFNIHFTERLFGSKKMFINATALIVSACLILVAISPSIITIIIAIILIGGFASARTSYINTEMNEFIPAEQRATILSATSNINMIIFAIANPIVGLVADHSLRLAFLGVGILPLIAFFLLRYKSNSKDQVANIAWKGDEPTEIVTDSFNDKIIKPGDKVLDLGSGFGRNSNWLAQKGAIVTAINIDDEEIREAKEKAEKLGVDVNYLHADATELPFQADSFDVVLDLGCSHMIPSQEDQKKAELEIARVLKPNGMLIYFGFSKNHPAYLNKLDSPMFRDLEDIKETYGNDFDILSSKEDRWKVNPEEKSKVSEHVGLNIVMKKKS